MKLQILLRYCFLAALFSSFLFQETLAQEKHTKANQQVLKSLSTTLFKEEKEHQKNIQLLAAKKGWALSYKTKGGVLATLVEIDDFGLPIYYAPESNVNAAGTTRANTLYAGGSLGLSLSGSTLPLNSIGLFESGGRPLATHVEFPNNKIDVRATGSVSQHATHVAGTIAGVGVNATARGMVYNLPKLLCFGTSTTDMSNYAANFLFSNHSYGTIAGWDYNSSNQRWSFYGSYGETEDYKFGYYNSTARTWDNICYNAPYYLPVKSAGNHRDDVGPAVGQEYWGYNASGVMVNMGPRPAGIKGDNGYDTQATYNTAKNTLVVGNIRALPNGSSSPSDIILSASSSWGPTDDGRIKPDVVANGTSLFSASNGSNTSYATLSGTSMATPNALGTLALLQELYAQKNNSEYMRSATIKGLTIATTSEAGPHPGPDYMHGWGLVNAEKAGKAILNRNVSAIISENTLQNGNSYTINIVPNGTEPLVATICWTDPAATVIPVAQALNNPTLRLVNDLDMRVSEGSNTHFPWILDPANPAAAATTGDNFRDNVEQIFIENPIPGKIYTLTITHKSTLQSGSQDFSLIVTGIGGTAYCTSAGLTATNSSLKTFSFSNLNDNQNNCAAYVNKALNNIELIPGKNYPISIELQNCQAASNEKVIKIYADFNNDGAFNHAEELLLNTGVISANTYNGNITIPLGINYDSATILRMVIMDTNDANTVNACDNIGTGQVIDYQAKITRFDYDLAMEEISLAQNAACAVNLQSVVVKVTNIGINSISNPVIHLKIYENLTEVYSHSSPYGGTIDGKSTLEIPVHYTFSLNPEKNYTIKAEIAATQDEYTANNILEKSFATNALDDLNGNTHHAFYCTTESKHILFTNATGTAYWYSSPTDTEPFAMGQSVLTAQPPTNGKYYLALNDYSYTIGSPHKDHSGMGSGSYHNGAVNLTIGVNEPSLLKSARLFVGNSGSITVRVSKEDIVLEEKTLMVAKTKTTAESSTANDPNDPGAEYMLDLAFPEKGTYTLRIIMNDNTRLYRNNNANNLPYPYKSKFEEFNLVSHNGNANTGQFYYYFYNMQIMPLQCKTQRVEVEVEPSEVSIGYNGTSLVSSIAVDNQWYRDGTAINGATSATYAPTQSGSYTVISTLVAGCPISSLPYVLDISQPVDLLTFTANKTSQGVDLKWTIINETIHNKQFEVYRRSETSTDYELIATIPAKNAGSYSFIDFHPQQGSNYYELHRINHNNETTSYGPIEIRYEETAEKDLVAYPVPTKLDVFIKASKVLAAEFYDINIYSLNGQLMEKVTVNGTYLINGHPLSLAKYSAGHYLVKIVNKANGKKVGVLKIIKQ